MNFDGPVPLVAAVDIGTNTAHLIVARTDRRSGQIEIIDRKRHYIFLAEDGIEHIGEAARSRLLAAFDDYKQLVAHYGNPSVKVCGTAALREATNSEDIVKDIYSKYGWQIDVISGQREAELIFTGASAAVSMTEGHHLIMDIGGGSVEFIGVAAGQSLFLESYPIGIANLYRYFHQEEPMSPKSRTRLYRFLDKQLSDLLIKVNASSTPFQLVGCAGTFEVLQATATSSPGPSFRVSSADFRNFYDRVFQMSLDERLKTDLFPAERATYIVVAFTLINYLLEKLRLDHFQVSSYALKEGILLS